MTSRVCPELAAVPTNLPYSVVIDWSPPTHIGRYKSIFDNMAFLAHHSPFLPKIQA